MIGRLLIRLEPAHVFLVKLGNLIPPKVGYLSLLVLVNLFQMLFRSGLGDLFRLVLGFEIDRIFRAELDNLFRLFTAFEIDFLFLF